MRCIIVNDKNTLYADVELPSSRRWREWLVRWRLRVLQLSTNSADVQRSNERPEGTAVVSNSGDILLIQPAIFKSTCNVDITHFPFDVQSCRLKFGSWTYDGFKLNIDFYDGKDHVDTSDYIESNAWDLIKSPASKNVKYYTCCIEPFPDLIFTIDIRHVPTFYIYSLLLPAVLLSFLTLAIFWLPPESPTKIILGQLLISCIVIEYK